MLKEDYTRVRLSFDDKKKLKTLADYFGVSMSEYIRYMIQTDFESLEVLKYATTNQTNTNVISSVPSNES